MIPWFPSAALLAVERFERQYDAYVRDLTAFGRVPASREVVLDEARRSTDPVERLLYRKRATLTP